MKNSRPTRNQRRKWTSDWVQVINCEGMAFVKILRDVPPEKREYHTANKMCEINRVKARKNSASSSHGPYSSEQNVFEEFVSLGEVLIEQVYKDVCEALLETENEPHGCSRKTDSQALSKVAPSIRNVPIYTVEELETMDLPFKSDLGKRSGTLGHAEPTVAPEEDNTEGAARFIIPPSHNQYRTLTIYVDGESLTVPPCVVSILRDIATTEKLTIRIRLENFRKLAESLPWVAENLTKDLDALVLKKAALYHINSILPKTIRVKTVSKRSI